MRVLGSIQRDRYEVHLASDLDAPPQLEIRWKQSQTDRRIKVTIVALYTWTRIAGDGLPRWLLLELKAKEPYLISHYAALMLK